MNFFRWSQGGAVAPSQPLYLRPCVTQIETSICNILTVTNENECKDPLIIKDKMAIRPERNRTKRYTILIPKILPKLNSIVIFQLNSNWLYHILEGFWHTPYQCIHISLFHILLQVCLLTNSSSLSISIEENSIDDFLHHQFLIGKNMYLARLIN